MDIVKRLNGDTQCFCSIRKEAADEIERLRSMTKVNLEAFQNNVAEIERLREALKKIAAEPIHQCVSRLTQPPICDRAWIARSALQQNGSE